MNLESSPKHMDSTSACSEGKPLQFQSYGLSLDTHSVRMKRERRIVNWITSCIVLYVFGAPVVTLMTALTPEESGLFIRLSAVAYGLPLVIACGLGLRLPP